VLSGGGAERLANGLGWFSIGLGVAEIAAPGGMARFVGIEDDEDNRAVLRSCGVREVASGVSILSQRNPTSALWSRVAGDVMDLFLLGTAAASPRARRGRLALATVAVAGVTLLDVLGSVQHSRRAGLMGDGQSGATPRGRAPSQSSSMRRLAERNASTLEQRGIDVKVTATVNRPVAEVFGFWRDLSNLPRFMHHLERVQVLDGKRSRWTASAPAGTTVEWEAEITEERPNALIAWRSLPGSSIENAGRVTFKPAPGGRGTEVQVELVYRPPFGRVGALVAKLFGEEPQEQMKHDLRMFKAVLETGEVVHSDASIHRGMHPAQPATVVRGSQTNEARGGAR
jgi:uncharacterized membrane protein